MTPLTIMVDMNLDSNLPVRVLQASLDAIRIHEELNQGLDLATRMGYIEHGIRLLSKALAIEEIENRYG